MVPKWEKASEAYRPQQNCYHCSMKLKKAFPFLLLVLMVLLAVTVKRCNNRQQLSDREKSRTIRQDPQPAAPEEVAADVLATFRNPETDLFFTKHARCRMKCRRISKEEVHEIVQQAAVNLKKSDPDAPGGARYALEGYTTAERQHVRVIVAPKQRHLTIITVIDLDTDWQCPDCK